MANITDKRATDFSNNYIRPLSNNLGKSYYRDKAVGSRWIGLGSNQAALDQMQPDIKAAADQKILTFDQSFFVEKSWFMNQAVLFPNDASPVFDNNGASQDTSRPLITGAMVNNLITRGIEFQNWLLSMAGAFNGTFQVETATAVGTITGAGNATVIVTAFGMNNSPKTISVAVANTDTAATWAGKVRTALTADADVGGFFTVSGAGASIILTPKTLAVFGNDPTLNVSLANGTCTGITAAPSSANTTVGVAVRGGVSWFQTVMMCSSFGPSPVVLSDAGNFINRCTELVTNYEANSFANLNTILAVATNPQPNVVGPG